MKTRFINQFLLPALIAGLGLTLTLDSAAGASGEADLSLTASVEWYGRTNNPLYFTTDLSYFITVSNAGPSEATGVVVSNEIPTGTILISATGSSASTNGVLLVDLGSLAVGATNSIQIIVQNTNLVDEAHQPMVASVFQVFSDQADPDTTNNFVSTLAGFNTTIYSTSTRTIDTNLTSSVNQQATNYSTELIAVMPGGTVLFNQTFSAAFSDPTVQAAVTQGAGDFTGAGATSYTGPIGTNASQILVNSSSVTATNAIGTDLSFATTDYVGPRTLMVGPNQSQLLFLFAGQQVYDTLVTALVTNLVTTTNTSTYLDSAVYTMTAIVARPELGLAAVHSNQFAFTITGTSNLSIVVEACTNLASPSWTPLQICTLTNGPIYFSDPAWRSYPMRFYWTRLP